MKYRLASVAAISALALPSLAGIKYWDNPEFRAYDVDSYVQDGLVLNYDGIRNAGADKEHDSAATTWVNLGTGGADYDMTRYSLVSSAWTEGAAQGAWTDSGFVFNKDTVFFNSNKFTIPKGYSAQVLVAATSADQNGIGYIVCPWYKNGTSNNYDWQRYSLGIRSSSFKYPANGSSDTAVAKSMYVCAHQQTGGRAAISGDSFTYATAILDTNDIVIFSGTTAPWSAGNGGHTGHQYNTSSGVEYSMNNGMTIGGHYDRTDELFKGTLKTYRFYNKVLSDEEVAWNRVVDEARYFHRRSALPVTNVVVASNIPVATGDEPTGCYAVDGSHVFSAPATKVVKGRTYTLDGFTVETWDGSAWGAAVQHNGETSYTASDSALVRITWQWTVGDGLVRYDADDYVQYGLVLNYDGIRNAGLGAAHDSAATTWANLGNGGAAYDMTRYSLVDSAWTEGSAQGAWTDTGFTFGKNSVFNETEPLLVPTKRTMQILVDAKASAQGGIGDVVGCYNGTMWSYFSICMRSSGTIANSFYLNANYSTDTGVRPAIYNDSATYDYGTAIVNGNDAVFFAGTEAPWSATSTGGKTGHWLRSGYTSTDFTDSGISLGGRYPSQDQRFTGTVKSFRFYDRCLTDAEVAWNRVVDDWRYSATAVTNVVVASTRGDIQGNEPDGVYEVSGSYTFTAPESVTVGNVTYAPDGYAIQAWDATTGGWGAATEYEGASYAYTVGMSPDKVRLLWRWKAVRGIRTAADYDVSDYVAGGLVLNFDGIRNAGADAAHDPAATTWANLGTDGAKRNAPLNKTADLAWTENGYNFDGTRKFVVPATGVGTASHTVQFLTDAVQNDQQDPGEASIFFFSGLQAAFAAATYGGTFYYRIQGNGNDGDLRFTFDKAEPIGYVTAITDAEAKKAYVFPGDAKPTAAPGVKSYETISTPSFGELAIGGWGGGLTQYMKGGINCFRYYDRVLSDAELAQNRVVDEARFFGRIATNVVVAVEDGSGITADEATETPFVVEGAYTFTAQGGAGTGYRLSVPDGNGGWRTLQSFAEGDSYTYTTGTSPDCVKIEWRVQKPFVLVVR